MTRSTTAAPSQPSPTAEHKLLGLFLGDWLLEGRQHAGPVGDDAEISGTERFEWLDGGLYLVHHFAARVGGAPAACIEILGWNGDRGRYHAHTYYNNGQQADWELVERDGTWILSGAWPNDGAMAKVRCTIEFADGGQRRTARWEMADASGQWRTFWDVTATRRTA